jgi:hypothetical protein
MVVERFVRCVCAVCVVWVCAVVAQPSIALVSPEDGSVYEERQTIPLAAQLEGAAASEVLFFAGEQSLGAASASPYAMDWTDATEGTYSLTAMAALDDGTAITSPSVGVTVAKSTAAQADDWEYFSGPEGAYVQYMHYVGGRLLVGNDIRKMRYSDDGADTWHELTPASVPPNYSNTGFTRSTDSRLLVTTTDSKVYASLDKGMNWVEKMSGLPSGLTGLALQGVGELVTAHSGNRTFLSTNGGDSWSELGNGGIPSGFRFAVVCQSGSRLVASISSSSGAPAAHFCYSTDGGANWTMGAMDDGSSLRFAASQIVGNGTRVCAIASSRTLYISDDNGATFSEFATEFSSPKVTVVGSVWCIADKEAGLLELSSDGTTVTPRNQGMLTTNVTGIVSSGDAYWVSTDIGVYRAADLHGTWTPANKGIGSGAVFDIVPMGDELFAGTSFGVWRSTTHGRRWLPMGVMDQAVRSVLVNGSSLYAAGDSVYVSDDGGDTWQALGTNFPSNVISPLRLATAGGNLVMAAQNGSNRGVYVLTGFAGAWTRASGAPDQNIGLLGDGDVVYGNRARGTNGGTSWSSVSGFNNETVYAYTKNGSYIYAGCFIVVTSGSRRCIYRSDNGTSFTPFTAGLANTDDELVEALCTTGDTVVVAAGSRVGGGSKVQTYINIGNSATGWTALGSTIDIFGTNCLLATPQSLLLGCAKGLYRYARAELPSVPATADSIVYPPLGPVADGDVRMTRVGMAGPIAVTGHWVDPASGALTVRYAASRGGVGRFMLLDANGRMVARVTEQLQAGSPRLVRLGASALPAGLYVCRLSFGDAAVTRRILVSR